MRLTRRDLMAQCGALSVFGPVSLAAQEATVAVAVDPRNDLGPLPRLFRPSAMLTWADREAVQRFLALPGPLGAVRASLEAELTASIDAASYRDLLRKTAPGLAPFFARGATVIVTFARMPAWLARDTGNASAGEHGFSVREASPPADLAKLEQLAFDTAQIIRAAVGRSPSYEFWNEPDARSFWRGSRADLFNAYAAFAAGIRRGDAAAQVGGPTVGGWDAKMEAEPDGSEPLVKGLLKFAKTGGSGGRPVPLDFLSWHNFGGSPEAGWGGADEIDAWFKPSGYATPLPQFITEWNLWSTYPNWFDLDRDTAVGAAFLAASLHGMRHANVAAQTFAAIQDFKEPTSGQAYPGDFGLLTKPPVLEKASFQVLKLQARLGDRLVATTVPEAARIAGIGALATVTGSSVSVLLHRYAGDPLGTVIRSLQTTGLRRFAELGVPQDLFLAYMQGKAELPFGTVGGTTQAALAKARDAGRAAATAEARVSISLAGLERARRHEVLLIDDAHGDPGGAYRAARAGGQGHAAALAKARAAQAPVSIASGNGPPPAISLARHAVALVRADL